MTRPVITSMAHTIRLNWRRVVAVTWGRIDDVLGQHTICNYSHLPIQYYQKVVTTKGNSHNQTTEYKAANQYFDSSEPFNVL